MFICVEDVVGVVMVECGGEIFGVECEVELVLVFEVVVFGWVEC